MFASKNFQFTGEFFVFNTTLSTNTVNYNLNTVLASAGWDGKRPVVANVLINSGVEVSSSASTTAAFLVNTLPYGSRVYVINNGIVFGRGGNGGVYGSVTQGIGSAGGAAIQTSAYLSLVNNNIIAGGGGGSGLGGDTRNSFCQGSDGGAGGAGGNAIVMLSDVVLVNNGTVAGGGGGGGGGASYQSGTANESFSTSGGSGGGGRGYSGGIAAFLGTTTPVGGCSFGYVGDTGRFGAVGTNGTWSSAGTGGAGGVGSTVGPGGAGGNGGSLGAAGSAGVNVTDSPVPRNGGAGGAAGRAVLTTSGILTVTNNSSIIGAY